MKIKAIIASSLIATMLTGCSMLTDNLTQQATEAAQSLASQVVDESKDKIEEATKEAAKEAAKQAAENTKDLAEDFAQQAKERAKEAAKKPAITMSPRRIFHRHYHPYRPDFSTRLQTLPSQHRMIRARTTHLLTTTRSTQQSIPQITGRSRTPTILTSRLTCISFVRPSLTCTRFMEKTW